MAPPARDDDCMMWGAAAACFFGFFRAGELTVPTATAFDAAVHLAWGDVAVDAADPPAMVRVFLKRSKTDQFGRGVEVFFGATGDDICPVAAIRAYANRRGATAGPFFRCVDGSPLTKARFVDGVRRALTLAGIPSVGYFGHSFRIGAATAAARAGVQDSVIQALGRWSSPAFLRYIRTLRESLATHTRTTVNEYNLVRNPITYKVVFIHFLNLMKYQFLIPSLQVVELMVGKSLSSKRRRSIFGLLNEPY